MLKSKLRSLVLGIALLGTATLSAVVFLAEQVHEVPYNKALTAHFKWGNPPIMDAEGWYDGVSKFDFVAYTPGVWRGHEADMDSLRKRNLDIFIGEYYNVQNITYWMKDSYDQSPTASVGAELWGAMIPYIVYTDEGDTASIWHNNPLFNVIDPDARAAFVSVINAHVRDVGLDFLFLDFISDILPNFTAGQGEPWVSLVNGEPDYDEDGIDYYNDVDEREAVLAGWYSMMDELQAALPADCMLFPNGSSAMYTDALAIKVDGCYSEDFPYYFYGTQGANYDNALDMDYAVLTNAHKLTKKRYKNGAGYVFMSNTVWHPYALEMSKMFDQCVWVDQDAVEPESIQTFTPLILGTATGPIVQSPYLTGYKLNRTFEKGELELRIVNNALSATVTYY